MNSRIVPIFFLLMAFFGCSALLAEAQKKSILKLADEYSLALAKYEKQKSRSSVETVIRKGNALTGNLSEMEDLSDADFALLEKKMRGYTVNRQEILFINPEAKFFLRLAKIKGTKADLAFFTLMRRIRPENVWAVYLEPQTDYSGCTIYGNGRLTGLYGKAVQFKKTYPKAYLPEINDEIEKILDEFTDEGCACGTSAGVIKEFSLFIKTFPKDKNTPAIKRALAKIKKNRKFRFNCQSG